MHACSLARALAIRHIIIPQNAGVLSALGLLLADVKKDFSQTVLLQAEDVNMPRIDYLFASLEEQARLVFLDEGFAPVDMALERFLDMRYAGQSYEVTVRAEQDFLPAFHREHFRLYGHSDDSRSVELVNVRLAATGAVSRPRFSQRDDLGKTHRSALLGEHDAVFELKHYATPIYDRAKLRPGNQFHGPAIVTEMSATTVVEPEFDARVDTGGNLLIHRRKGTNDTQ